MVILCLVGFVVLSAISGLGVVQSVRTNNKIDKISAGFTDFFTNENNGDGTAFNQVVNSVADVIAEKQAITTQAAIRGGMGGVQRTINQGLTDVAVQENPGLAAVEMLPKSLRKNPMAMMGLEAIMRRVMAGSAGAPGSGSAPGNGSTNPQAKFSL